MTERVVGVVAMLMVAGSVSAQNSSRPGEVPHSDVVGLAEPLVVDIDSPTQAAVQAHNRTLTNDGGTAVGLYATGREAIFGSGILGGGAFRASAPNGVGISAFGQGAGVAAYCMAPLGCNAVTATSTGDFGVGVRGEGNIGVYGRGKFEANGYRPAFAGYFEGPVRVTGDLQAPVIDVLRTQIQQMQEQIKALQEGGSGGGGIRTMPGVIQAVDYTSFSDNTAGNIGGYYRNDDVDIKQSREGFYAVGWMTAGEWLGYTFDISRTSTNYSIGVRIGSAFPGRSFHVELDGQNISGALPVPQMENWDMYETVTLANRTIQAGRHTLRVVLDVDHADVKSISIE